VLNYRAMVHGVRAARYWELGDDDREFRYNNYISRYHTRHLDLMDLLGMYQSRVPLDEFAQLLGLPGKVGMHGSEVWEAFQAGRMEAIRNYCEADVANTYLVFVRFQHMRGCLSDREYADECALVRAALERLPGAHWKAFLDGWKA
jgi:predicted PolB exonuclease-like 3'-5' exonuclease